MSESKTYWKAAANAFRDRRLLTFAALIIALRVAVKFLKIPLVRDCIFPLTAM